MAARVGVQQSVVSAYEGRAREPSLATPSSPVEACGVTLELHPGDELPTRARPGGVGPVGRRLTRRRAAVLATAARHGMTDLRVFGSLARGQDTDDSDLDLLVHVPEGTGLLTLGRFIRSWRTSCTCGSTSSLMTASSLASVTAFEVILYGCEPQHRDRLFDVPQAVAAIADDLQR